MSINLDMDIPSTSTTQEPSVDRIRFQIERIAGSIHNIEYTVVDAGKSIVSRGEQTWNNIQNTFMKENQTVKNVEHLIDIAEEKFSDWPVDSLFAVLITALILILFGLLYLAMKGAEKCVERRYKVTVNQSDDDIENL